MQIAILIAAAVLVALAGYSLLSPARSTPIELREKRRNASSVGSPYHAVSIHPAPSCCTAVESIAQKRFLSEEAPGLPLPGCEIKSCHCRYVHHADRRTGTRDRRMGDPDAANEAEFWNLRDRRTNPGRRASDTQSA